METVKNIGVSSEMTHRKRPLKKFFDLIISMFKPEEVEVTFGKKGNNVTYTYTKVTHKQVA